MQPLPAYVEPVDTTDPSFADFYDELPLWSAPFGLLLLERLPMQPGLTVLDLGAGTGFLTVELAQRCGPTTTVIAVDPWPSVMQRLRRKLDRLHLQNVRLLEQDAVGLDLPDASVDLAVSNLGINNFDRPEAVLEMCLRVVKPGGRLVLTTNLVGHMQEFYDAFRVTLIEVDLADRLTALDAHVRHRATVASLSTQLSQAGFEPGHVTTASFQMRFADGSSLLRHHFIRVGFLPAWRALVPPEALARTFAALERRLNTISAAQGGLVLTIPMACVEAVRPAVTRSSS